MAEQRPGLNVLEMVGVGVLVAVPCVIVMKIFEASAPATVVIATYGSLLLLATFWGVVFAINHWRAS